MLSQSSIANHPPTVHEQLLYRMKQPQRHRLLQGYPMMPLMRGYAPEDPHQVPAIPDTNKELIVGIMPHTFCNPTIRDCGFCTFPNQKYDKHAASITTARVCDEIYETVRNHPGLGKRCIRALYFGGATANLTPHDAFVELCESLCDNFNLQQAEVTLEGAPVFFATHQNKILRTLLSSLKAQQFRISMGVQSFDPRQIARMGRQHFGDQKLIAHVVTSAQQMGMTASCDLLFNLPFQTTEDALRDLQVAIDMGFDQICPYNLVLYPSLGTVWSKQPEMLAAQPRGQQAEENWYTIRDYLLSHGYQQTTLTNFERQQVIDTPHQFRYEALAFSPERYDILGFGPMAMSLFIDTARQQGIKWANERNSYHYANRITADNHARTYEFPYQQADWELLYLTRKIARTHVSLAELHQHISPQALEKFTNEFEALQKEKLVAFTDQQLALTPKGMYFADSVAGLLAAPRALEVARESKHQHTTYSTKDRRHLPINEAREFHMG
jgi:coproporphyrinogen III oxidase-like Fe-S oxidoreductase